MHENIGTNFILRTSLQHMDSKVNSKEYNSIILIKLDFLITIIKTIRNRFTLSVMIH